MREEHHALANVLNVRYTNVMNVKEINAALAGGRVDDPRVLPRLSMLSKSPFVFRFQFGLDRLPMEPGIIMIRGPRQYGKSTWLEQRIRESVLKFGPGSAYYLNGDEIADAAELVQRIRELAASFNPRRKVNRLFIDEITAIDDWQKALKRLADAGELSDILVVTTGSRAADLRRGAERLLGRKARLTRTSYYFTPVPFAEFRRVSGDTLGPRTLVAYLLSGGSPLACSHVSQQGFLPEHVIETMRDWIYGECTANGRSRVSLHAVLEAMHRFGGTPLGQAKLAREAGLANNTVAAGYIEMLSDLMCVAPAFAWDSARNLRIARKPCKYHFTNLLAAVAWGSDGLRSPKDFEDLPPDSQGKWLEWLVAQELRRQKCLRGEDFPEVLSFWQSPAHEVDFVVDRKQLVEVKRGSAVATDFAWFSSIFPDARLLVVGGNRFEARAVRGVTMEDFLADATELLEGR